MNDEKPNRKEMSRALFRWQQGIEALTPAMKNALLVTGYIRPDHVDNTEHRLTEDGEVLLKEWPPLNELKLAKFAQDVCSFVADGRMHALIDLINRESDEVLVLANAVSERHHEERVLRWGERVLTQIGTITGRLSSTAENKSALPGEESCASTTSARCRLPAGHPVTTVDPHRAGNVVWYETDAANVEIEKLYQEDKRSKQQEHLNEYNEQYRAAHDDCDSD